MTITAMSIDLRLLLGGGESDAASDPRARAMGNGGTR